MAKTYTKSIHREFCGNGTSKEIIPPKYFCYSCEKYVNNRCLFFNRPVIGNYNKCFHHSFYSPVAAVFKAPENLDEIIQKEEEKIA